MEKFTKFGQPRDLGKLKLYSPQVLYYLYYPISQPADDAYAIEERLRFIQPMIEKIREDIPERFENEWVYVTAKKMYIGGGVTANRPGWHCDGFMSTDLNYIWYDNTPTVFNHGAFSITPDHVESLKEFERQAKSDNDYILPNEHLVKLDSTVIHRVNTDVPEQIMRTFVKITVSPERFNLKDNSINPAFPPPEKLYDRSLVRNDPFQAQKDAYKPNTPVDDHLR